MSVTLKKKGSDWKTDEAKFKEFRKKHPKGYTSSEFKKAFPSGMKTAPSRIKSSLESTFEEMTSSRGKKSKSKSKKEVATKLASRNIGSDKGVFKNVYEKREVTKGRGGRVKVKSKFSKAGGFTHKGVGMLDEVRVSADPKRNRKLIKEAKIKLRRKKKDTKREQKLRRKSDRVEGRLLTRAERRRA
mgnify:CR=1 FL=1